MFGVRAGVLFRDRKDAGISLGEFLKNDYENTKPLILGIPRGGVEIAYYVAKVLNTDFEVVVSKKLGYPGQEELAFGAITEDGSVYISSLGRSVNKETTERVIEAKKKEIERRIALYRKGKPLSDLKNRTVIIVDDGIATGSTIVPVIKMCKNYGAAKVVVASPVAPSTTLDLLSEADELQIMAEPEPFYAVGQFYDDFINMTDEDVFKFLKD